MNKNGQKFLAQRIRAQYMEKEATELDELRALDAEVKRPASLFGYIFGSVGAVVMGAGMSLVMTDIGAALGMAATMVPGILIGLIGLAMAVANYPIYSRILARRKEKYAARILELSERLMHE